MVQTKLKLLSKWVEKSSHLVIVTGAGISTTAGIPDFRGPKGIWTLEKQHKQSIEPRNKKQKLTTIQSASNNADMDFSKAKPTLTHRAITKLATTGKLKYCITQNVDGLHKRAGLSRSYHSALHGCVFTEKCIKCESEFFRDQDVGGMSFQPTGNKCEVEMCDGNLHDTLLDWEDALPEKDFERAERECEMADLVLCLGTSLRIEPVGSLPLLARRFVIVNLQTTPKDEYAAMIIRAPVDDVMDDLLNRIGYEGWKTEPPATIERSWTPDKQPLQTK